jgi:dGTP triphosphohydrolase
MFENVYFSDKTKGREQEIAGIVEELYRYYKAPLGAVEATDYVAGMSDEFAIRTWEKIKNVEARV